MDEKQFYVSISLLLNHKYLSLYNVALYNLASMSIQNMPNKDSLARVAKEITGYYGGMLVAISTVKLSVVAKDIIGYYY